MRILTITRIFPNRTDPMFGTFILDRVKAMAGQGHEVHVVAPVPYVPPGPVPLRHRPLRSVPSVEDIDGFRVDHPRFIAVPKVGRLHARSYARGIEATVRRLVETFQPDILDGNYLYPDACGVAQVARRLGLPHVCTARGSDVTYFGRRRPFRNRMRRALAGAAEVHAVSEDLAREMRDRGIHGGEIRVIRNGVDPERFHPGDRAAARRRLGLPPSRSLGICVAHLVREHRHDLLIRALRHPDAPRDLQLLLVGHGDRRGRLERITAALHLEDRVRFVGPVAHGEIPEWLNASDFSILLSERSGCPNIVLESSACGIPCLLSDIQAMREMVDLGHPGRLVVLEEGAGGRRREP